MCLSVCLSVNVFWGEWLWREFSLYILWKDVQSTEMKVSERK